MKKIILMTCVLSFAAMPSLYAQSKKQIIASQQQKIEQQQQQIDSLNRVNGYLQGNLDQLSNQFNRLDSVNTKLTFQNQEFQHQIDSLNFETAKLTQALQAKEQENKLLQEEKVKQQKAAAAQKQAQEKAKQVNLEEYRKQCVNSENRLEEVFYKENSPIAYNSEEANYVIDRFQQTKTALLETYEKQCNAGKVSSLNQVKWHIEQTMGAIPNPKGSGITGPYKHQYTFMVECPNGRSYQAYEFCFITEIGYQLLSDIRTFVSYCSCSANLQDLLPRKRN